MQPDPMPSRGRRAERRDAVSLPVVVVSGLFDAPIELDAADLSPAGMFLPCDVLLPEDEPVLVGFMLPGTWHRVLIDARVVRARGDGLAGIGLQFGKLPFLEESALRDALERHRARPRDRVRDGSFRC